MKRRPIWIFKLLLRSTRCRCHRHHHHHKQQQQQLMPTIRQSSVY